MYSYNSDQESSFSMDRIYATADLSFTKHEKLANLVLNILNCIYIWFNFYLIDFLDLFKKIFSFFLIFRPKLIRRKFFKIKSKIDKFFSNKIVPIVSLNNIHLFNRHSAINPSNNH